MRIDLRKSNPDERHMIRSLLMEAKLPSESIGTDVTKFYIAEEDGRLVGIAGFEFYGEDALLRSVAVPVTLRRKGIGSVIVDLMIEEARKLNVREVVLLTETAKDFFLRKGFAVADRMTITNEEMRKSSEFAQVCPQSAVCMTIELKHE